MDPSTARNLLALYNTARLGFLKQSMRMLLSSSFVLILMMSCTPPPKVTQAAANALSLSINVLNQFTPSTPNVFITVGFFLNHNRVFLDGNQSLACNGVVFTKANTPEISLPRQPAGGAYTCVYSDEKGNKTPLIIQVPPGVLSITSPAAGAVLPIPGITLPASGTLPRPPERTGTLRIGFTLPTPPTGARQYVFAQATCGSGIPPECGQMVTGYRISGTETYVLTDANVPYGRGFETFTSGSRGEIQVSSLLSWSPPAGGFQGVSVEFNGDFIIPVTWSRA